MCVVSPQGPCDSLGISVAGGVASPHGNVPLFIATMDTNGLAAKTQQLQVGTALIYAPARVCIVYSSPALWGRKYLVAIRYLKVSAVTSLSVFCT